MAMKTAQGAYAEKNDGTSKKEEKKRPRLEPRCDWNNMHSSDATEVSKFSRSDIKNFNIVVKGLIIDSELPSTHVRTKYHDLCCTQKSYIHEGFLPNIDSKMGSLYRKAME